MIGEHSVIELLLHASLIVQFVMALLAGASVLSWAIILRKRKVLVESRQLADRFDEQFWSGGDLATLLFFLGHDPDPEVRGTAIKSLTAMPIITSFQFRRNFTG